MIKENEEKFDKYSVGESTFYDDLSTLAYRIVVRKCDGLSFINEHFY